MSRKPIIAGNWKMNNAEGAAGDLATALVRTLGDVTAVDIVICPPATSLHAAVATTAGSAIAVGAQNVHWAENGAFTGELAASMLTAIPIDYVIIGHSERRQYFGETDETVNKRLRAALNAELRPIVCCGETLEQRRAGEMTDVVTRQVTAALKDISAKEAILTTLAYEPIWAIGTGETASPEQAQEVHRVIRDLLVKLYDKATAEEVRIQYGGSVKSSNVASLMSQPDIDGALVGGASLKASEFTRLVLNAIS